MADMVEENMTCPATGYQRVGVCVPVTVKPFAKTEPTITKCCGEPIVVSGETPCSGTQNGSCKFTISQTLCIEVPVDFGAVATVGDTYVNCLGAESDDICSNCTGGEIV